MDRQSDILLESGTNELGVMEFTIGGEVFGINVAKVLEIMMACPVVPMQKAQKDIEGIFKSRDMLLTVIDLASYLGLPPSQNPGRDIFIITRFNNANFAFHVHTVVGIDRISWTEIKKPDRIIYGGQDGVATGAPRGNQGCNGDFFCARKQQLYLGRIQSAEEYRQCNGSDEARL